MSMRMPSLVLASADLRSSQVYFFGADMIDYWQWVSGMAVGVYTTRQDDKPRVADKFLVRRKDVSSDASAAHRGCCDWTRTD